MKKLVKLVIAFMIMLQTINPIFLYIEAKNNKTQQPEVCWWPSKTMSLYFDFQNEARSVLLWSKLSERVYSTNVWSEWLFRGWILKLPGALDILASDVLWEVSSAFSTALTSYVLLIMASASVVQSNMEWFAILFRDRPIVRDYKTMLDIETELFDLAYFRSKEVNLTLPLEWDIYDNFNKLLEKYQELWLIKATRLKWGESMADIVQDLINMNGAMRYFISYLGNPWAKALKNYNWCFWNVEGGNCTSSNAILKFDEKAIQTLKEDYSGLGVFSACNQYLSNFTSTIFKSVNNNSNSVKIAFQDVKDAMKRLKWALVSDYGSAGDWEIESSDKNSRCNVSEYEMAQLRAYWWSDWRCWDWVSVSVAYSKIHEFSRNKKAQNDQNEKVTNVLKEAATTTSAWAESLSNITGKGSVTDQLKEWSTNNIRRQKWQQLYGAEDLYNTEFYYDMAYDIESIYRETINEYYQSQQDAIAQDLITQMWEIKWLISQVDEVIKVGKILKDDLQVVADYQWAR